MAKLSIMLALVLCYAAICTAHPPVVKMSMVNPSSQLPKPLIGRPDGHEPAIASINSEWKAFKAKFSKAYKDVKEEYSRMLVFARNLYKINQHNKAYAIGLKSFSLDVNAFTDMTVHEYRRSRTCYHKRTPGAITGGITYLPPAVEQQLPNTVDWRKMGAVTPVKDQGQCGSCWSFSTTGSLEGQGFRKTGKLLSLSEQQLVDCSSKFGNMGCNGGLMDNAFRYIEKFGLEKESTYPYRGRQYSCRYSSSVVVANCTGFVDIPAGSETALKQAVANVGPVSVAIDASHSSFQMYRNGVYDEPDCNSEQLDHGVLVVGYGTERGKDYWLVKNSWNTHWGDNGYIKMARNKGNQCGIASSASYPTV